MRSPFAHAEPATLVRAWYSASEAGTWGDYEEWHLPAVDAVAEAIVEHRDAAEAARRLGEQRAESGIGIREGLNDLDSPYQLHLRSEPPHAVSLAFAEGWADAEVAALMGRASTDPLTGLATFDYVCARLGELYSEPEKSERSFVLVDAGARRRSGSARLTRSLGISNLLRSVFSSGETTAILPNGLFVAIVDGREGLGDYLGRLTRSVGAFDDDLAEPVDRVRVWVEPLPRTRALAEQLLLSLDTA